MGPERHETGYPDRDPLLRRSSSKPSPPGPDRRRAPMSLAGLGMELAAAVIGATLLGFWIDRKLESEPWGVVIGALVGIVGGLYNFVRQASRAARSTRDRDQS